MTQVVSQFGYVPMPARTAAFNLSLPIAAFGDTPAYRDGVAERDSIDLVRSLLRVKPTWKRGAQGIGDCVSWGWELCGSMRFSLQHELGISEWIEEVATESIYGGSRVEQNNGNPILGKTADGSYGSAAAKWVRQWGMLLRLNYSDQTGNQEHDLRVYDGKERSQRSFDSKARRWGYYGCGGQQDNGKLDLLAEAHPCEVAPVKTTEEASRALLNGYPVAVCSNVGYGNMKRNSDGVVRASDRWPHCMMFGGTRRFKGRWQFKQYQSWGASCSGPYPGEDSEAVQECSWWTEEQDAQKQLNQNDSYAVSDLNGFPPQKFDLDAVADAWN